MIYSFNNQNFQIPIEFRDDFNAVSPDASSVFISIHDGSGSEVLPAAPLSPDGATRMLYTVPSIGRQLPSSSLTALYEILVRFTFNGGINYGTLRIPYTVVRYANHGASLDDVRNVLGMSVLELPDSDIDLFYGYISSVWDAGGTLFADALAAGGERASACRWMVVYRTAQEILPVLKVRLAQNVLDGTRQITRFDTDFDELVQSVNDRYGYYRSVVTLETDPSDLGFFATSVQADPFTG